MSAAHFPQYKSKQYVPYSILTYYAVRKMVRSEERIVFDLDTYFHLEIAGSSITRGKHLTVMLGVGPRDWQPGSG